MGTAVVTFAAAARDHLRGVRTFYVSSLSGEARTYTLKVIRRAGQRRMTCSCPDYHNRRDPVRRHCKHLRLLRELLRLVGGASKIPNGARATVPLRKER